MGSFYGYDEEIDRDGQKIGTFLGREGQYDSSGQKYGRFYGREGDNKKETPSKGCLRRYLVMRFLDYARNDIDPITC